MRRIATNVNGIHFVGARGDPLYLVGGAEVCPAPQPARDHMRIDAVDGAPRHQHAVGRLAVVGRPVLDRLAQCLDLWLLQFFG